MIGRGVFGLAGLAIGLAACGDGILTPGPPGSSHDVRPGDTITVDLSSTGQQLVLRYVPDAATWGAVYLQAVTGAVRVEVWDSARGPVVAPGAASSDAALALLDSRTGAFHALPGRVYHIVVDQPVIAARGRSRLVLHEARRAPEAAAPAIAPGDTVGPEPLDPSADIDDFAFDASAGQELIIFLGAPPAFRENALLAGVYPDVGLPYGRVAHGFVWNGPASVDLEASASGRFTVPATGRYYLTVLAASPPFGPADAHTGLFRVALLTINRQPETVPAALIAGDTVGAEAIDHVGDVDEFSLALAAGTEVNVLFRATGSPTNGLRVDLPEIGAPDAIPLATSAAGDTSLSRQATGTAVVPASGTLTIRVQGVSDQALDRGGYRLFPYVVDRRPETGRTGLDPGDSVTDERIELPGDIDEYQLTITDSVLLNVWITGVVVPAAEPGAGTLRVQMEAWSSGELLRTVDVFESASADLGVGSGLGPVAPGSYRLRVLGTASTGQGFRGPYRLYTGGIDLAPEGVPAALTIGDTVAESLEPLGDIDLFRFEGRRGQVLRAVFVDPGVPRGGGHWLVVSDSTGWPVLGAVGTAPATEPFVETRTGRMILPGTGTHRLVVSPINGGGLVTERGPYRFAVIEQPTDPEAVGAALTPGDSISDERIDVAGDVDDFVVSAPPGSELQTFVHQTVGTVVRAEVLDPVSYDVLRATVSAGYQQATGLVRVPSDGAVRVRVYAVNDDAPGPVPYSLWTYTISRAPEGGSSLIAIGDTVVGEIDPVGDIDEFAFDGQGGDVIEVLFDTPGGFGYPPARLWVVDPVTGDALGSVQSMNPVQSLDAQSTGAITLPRADRYIVRVASERDTENTGAYRFLVRPFGG